MSGPPHLDDRSEPCDVPVAFFVFNRPDVTREAFAAIRAARPTTLFVIADGPRVDVPTDSVRCQEVREIVGEVDWPCNVRYDFAERNLGLKRRIESGLTSVFSQVDRAIVLEDDCVAGPSFFHFCRELLERFESDPRVMTITGNNFQDGAGPVKDSYYFSKYPHCWGWATWARAWSLYDGEFASWEALRSSERWSTLHPEPVERRYWRGQFGACISGRVSTWDYPWTQSVWNHGGLTATPAVNLVRNVGFGADATHTSDSETAPSMTIGNLDFPLRHPGLIATCDEADRRAFDTHFGGAALRQRKSPVGLISWVVSGSLRRIRRAVRR